MMWNHTTSSVFHKLRELSAYEFFLKYDCGHTLARLRGGERKTSVNHTDTVGSQTSFIVFFVLIAVVVAIAAWFSTNIIY